MIILTIEITQGVPAGIIASAILNKRVCMGMCLMNCFLDKAISVYFYTDDKHTISSHELRSALMLPVEFSKM
jgi:hypothetical protein